jgi:hypothetical protein
MVEDYDPPTLGYDPPTWQQKLEFQRSSFRPLEKQAYEEQLVPMDLKRFIAPFAQKCVGIPYKIENNRMKWLYARYRSRLRELKYIEDCWVEKMNVGKLALPASPLPSMPGQNPTLLKNPKLYTDLGGRPLEPKGYWPTWDQRLETARASQIEAIRGIHGNPDYACPRPPKKTSIQLLHEKIDAICMKQLPKNPIQKACTNGCW